MTDQSMKTFAVHVGFFDGWTHGVVAIHAPDADAACRKAINHADTDPDFFDLVTRTDVVEGMPVFVAGVEEIADPDDVRTIPTPADGEPDDTGQAAVMARHYAAEIIAERDRLAALLREAVPFLDYLAAELKNPKPAENLMRRIEAALSGR